MLGIIYRIFKYLVMTVAFIIIFTVFIMPTVFHLKPFVIMSGSMLPEYPIGAICIIDTDRISPSEGTVISYDTEEKNILHRVVDITEEGYITKGDNNNVEDPEPVKQEQVCGTCVYMIPGVGKIALFMKSTTGIVLMIGIIVLMLITKLFFSVLDKNER